MLSNNTKVNRMLQAIACELKNADEEMIEHLHAIINDERDGYNFDF